MISNLTLIRHPQSEEPSALLAACSLLHLHANRCRRTAQNVEGEEGQDRTEVKTKDRGDDSAEQVEVGVGDGEHGLQRANPLRLREPAQQNSGGDNVVINLQEISKAADENLLCDAVARDGHCERGVVAADGHGTTAAAHAPTT